MSAPRRLNPDTTPVIVLTALTACAIAVSSFVLSFAGLTAVAEWGGVPAPLRALVPVMIDAAVLAYTLAWLVQRARHESTWLSWCSLALFTAVSTLGNALHGWMPPEPVQRIIGTAVVGLAPLAVLLATHTLAQLLTMPSDIRAKNSQPNVTPGPTLRSVPLAAVREDVAERRQAARPRKVRRHRGNVPPPEKVLALREEGLTIRAIAAQLGAAPSTVHKIAQEATA